MQTALDLQGGWHAGPLFEIIKKRPLVRPPGKAGMIHRAQQRIRTPAWLTAADHDAIRALYREAERLTQETGELHVVDHIVPKVNKIVSGLHVPWNLRVLHWKDNAVKSNFWWPDMPNSQMELI